jgi:L-fuconolactonase
MLRIDSHVHFWQVARGDYRFLKPSLTVLYRDFFPPDAKPLLDASEIDACIVVQAAATMEETSYMLKLYDQYEYISGVVGWLDLDSDSADLSLHYERFIQHPGFVGIRPMIQDLEDEWLLRPRVIKNLSYLTEQGLPIDLQANPRHLPSIIKLLKQIPDLSGVINHAAKPLIAQGIMNPWREQMAEIASYKQIMCKVSGLLTEINKTSGTIDDIKPYTDHLFEIFGSKALMYGSDWPVSLMANSYEEVYQAFQKLLPIHLTLEERDAVLGLNAKRFYRLRIERGKLKHDY